jgi:acyl-coenzyme A synthetase/AMP-(fatty) acid ligase
MAVWHAGGVAVLAPNAQPGTLAALGRGTLGLIGTGGDIPCGMASVAAVQNNGADHWPWRPLDRTAARLELLTSGTTGTPRVAVKTIANLEEEVLGLEALWGRRVAGRRVLATVSHQHIYGLLFRCLWPLSAGRAFEAETHREPWELVARIGEGEPCCLVATPAHLKHLASRRDGHVLQGHCGPIFSSGGPLDRTTAIRVASTFGAAPLEVFGSTETGGVAWRQQGDDDDAAAWTPFAGVAVSIDPAAGRLHVRSPFVSAPTGRLTMGDRAELLPDGRFALGPRADRVVKIGEKRLSLPEMEARLREHPFVADAALVTVEHVTTRRVGAAVVLTPEGREAIVQERRRGISRMLRRWLEPYWDPVLLPRVWRFVMALPQDAQGKCSALALQALIRGDAGPDPTAPDVLDEVTTEHGCRRTLRVPPALAYLAGHFPGFPLVPGVVQIQWVMDVVRRLTGQESHLRRIEALKFTGILRPGEIFELSAKCSPSGEHIDFRLWNERTLFSSGRCVLASRGGAEP